MIDVWLQPGAKKSEICGVQSEGALKLKVQAAPVDGAANKMLIEFLSEVTGLKKSQIEILHGESSRKKRIYLETSEVALRSVLSSRI